MIKGAGDLASGIACRLHNCGYEIVMTEIPVPTTVRRTVAFSRAVYEQKAVVEGITAVLCKTLAEVKEAVEQDRIAVVIDRECRILSQWKPDVAVDAIIAKKNLGTAIEDAQTVIGVGPGFEAGRDCHCVIETKRGHDLGRCLWQGMAAPNSGIPGSIGGYGKERLIRSPADGLFYGTASIGDRKAPGAEVGYVLKRDGTKSCVVVEIGGVVRGLLQDGVPVCIGMKAGDIDPRNVIENCYTVSDKARAIGGGVLEGIMAMEKKRLRNK